MIVVGCQRSGTTLVGQILGAHPKAVLLDEEDGLYDWAFEALGKWKLVKDRVTSDEVCRRASREYARALECFDSPGHLLQHIRFVVLKAPNLTYSWREISRLASARVVYVFRDPRAIVASMRRPRRAVRRQSGPLPASPPGGAGCARADRCVLG